METITYTDWRNSVSGPFSEDICEAFGIKFQQACSQPNESPVRYKGLVIRRIWVEGATLGQLLAIPSTYDLRQKMAWIMQLMQAGNVSGYHLMALPTPRCDGVTWMWAQTDLIRQYLERMLVASQCTPVEQCQPIVICEDINRIPLMVTADGFEKVARYGVN